MSIIQTVVIQMEIQSREGFFFFKWWVTSAWMIRLGTIKENFLNLGVILDLQKSCRYGNIPIYHNPYTITQLPCSNISMSHNLGLCTKQKINIDTIL